MAGVVRWHGRLMCLILANLPGRLRSLRSLCWRGHRNDLCCCPVSLRKSVMLCLNFRLLATTWLAFVAAAAIGAEIRQIDPSVYADVILEGEIKVGDYDKLLTVI